MKLPTTILGAGSWGSALAIALSAHGVPVVLWGRSQRHVASMQKDKANSKYLPDCPFPDLITVTNDLEESIAKAKNLLIAVPSHGFESIIEKIASQKSVEIPICWATKGLGPNGQLLSDIAKTHLGEDWPISVLSGPSFAKEVALGLPTAVVLSGTHKHMGKLLDTYHSKTFRVYKNDDMTGVQLAGAVKNVLAVATGFSDGLGYGANARSALITRGLAEMMRLGASIGAKEKTFMGLAGVGDTVLTCTDNQSRNRQFGLLIGEGNPLAQAEASIGQVVEGVKTATAVHKLARKNNIDAPIVEQVYEVVHGRLSVERAAKNLLSRKPKAEYFNSD